MQDIKYDNQGGITNFNQDLAKAEINNKGKKSVRIGYNFLERLLIKYSKKINYLFDANGKFKCREEKIPEVIRLGPTNRCTGQCFYCPREYVHERGSGYMDFSLYERIIKWAKKNKVKTISFALWGEPLLHPKFLDMLDLAFAAGLNVRFSTNAIILNKETVERVLDMPLQSIETSMDGFTREEYKKGKRVDKFDEAKKNILYLLKRAREKKSKIMFNVHFVDIGNVSFANKIRYIRFWKKQLKGLKYITTFSYEPHNWAGTRDNLKKYMNPIDRILASWELKKPCFFVRGLNVNWDGSIYICPNDPDEKAIIGNINENGITEIYQNAEREKFLTAHESGDYSGLNCERCTVNVVRPLSFIKKRIVNSIVGLFSR